MNVPGIASGNWRWRLETGMLRSHGAKYLRRMTEVTGRSSSDL
jgi:4-alpha-glucanotransferase